MTLPKQYTALPFSAARGVPQTVPYQQYQITILASTSDLPALLQTSPTQQIIDMSKRCFARPKDVVQDERALFRSIAPTTLDAIRPMIIVRDNDAILGSLPALVGTPLRFGTTDRARLELYVQTLALAAASLTQPGEVGAQMLIGVRQLVNAVDRVERQAPLRSEEDIYDLA